VRVGRSYPRARRRAAALRRTGDPTETLRIDEIFGTKFRHYLDNVEYICKLHIEMEERVMDNEERKSDAEARGPELKGVEARPRNWLVPVILLSLREWNSYGYELMERASKFGFEAMNPGTLYRTLRQMEKEGIVESTWETSRGGPARRMYSITDAGRSYLDFWAKSLEQYQQTMDNFFRLYTGRPPRPEGKDKE
jgi:PadR family transcriptional regulator, regulatory protein PadR